METAIYRFPDPENQELFLNRAARVLQTGGLAAFPTETVYGLGAVISRPDAVRRIFEVKGRPNDNPLIIHITGLEALEGLVREIPPAVIKLAERFWPGPLSLVLPCAPSVPAEVTAGLPTVAVRVPGHPLALELLRRTGIPVAAPSANLSGRPSPTTGRDVVEDLAGKIDVILDAGPTGIGVESTVLDLTSDKPRVLRPGWVTREMLEEFFGQGGVDVPWKIETDRPAAPGMKYRHYAPRAPLKVFSGPPQSVRQAIRACAGECLAEGKRVAVLGFDGGEDILPGAVFLSLGDRARPEEAARKLFFLLRECDRLGVDRIFGECPPAEGLGLAVVNRLWKAAGGDVIEL